MARFSLTGFILRCYPNGRKIWLVQYRDATGATRRVNIGDANVIEADRARAQAKQLLSGVTLGENPAMQREETRAAEKFGPMVERYLAYAGKRQKPSSLSETRRNLTKHCAELNTTPAKDVRRADIAGLHCRITESVGATAANRTLAALSALFGPAMATGVVEANPVLKVPRNVEVSRERVLSDAEIKAIWKAAGDGSDFGRIVRLLLLTGCRRTEVVMQRLEVQDNLWTVPKERMKNGLPHEVPLSSEAIAQLHIALRALQEENAIVQKFVFGRRADSGFSGWSKAKARLDKVVGFDNWGLHDFRRTMSTRLHEAGDAACRRSAPGAHLRPPGRRRPEPITRAGYTQQKREALDLWAGMIAKIVGNAA